MNSNSKGNPFHDRLAEEAFETLLPAMPLTFRFGTEEVSIVQRWLYFPEYTGTAPKESEEEHVVASSDRPFPALQVVSRLGKEGFVAGWHYRGDKPLSAWEPRLEVRPSLSGRAVLDRMNAWTRLTGTYWDVFAWKPEPRLIHLVRDGSAEIISANKLKWLEMALVDGIAASAFEIWRWFGGDLKGRTLRLTHYVGDQHTGWVEWKSGRLTYSGNDVRGMVDHYRGWGARTEADLLWLVFARNCTGITWCDIKERWEHPRPQDG